MTPQMALLYIGLPDKHQAKLDAVQRQYERLRMPPAWIRGVVSELSAAMREEQR